MPLPPPPFTICLSLSLPLLFLHLLSSFHHKTQLSSQFSSSKNLNRPHSERLHTHTSLWPSPCRPLNGPVTWSIAWLRPPPRVSGPRAAALVLSVHPSSVTLATNPSFLPLSRGKILTFQIKHIMINRLNSVRVCVSVCVKATHTHTL